MRLHELQNWLNTFNAHVSSGPRLSQLYGGTRKILCQSNGLKLLGNCLACHRLYPRLLACLIAASSASFITLSGAAFNLRRMSALALMFSNGVISAAFNARWAALTSTWVARSKAMI